MDEIRFRAWDKVNNSWYQFERFEDGSTHDGASWFAISGDGKMYSYKVGVGYIENEDLKPVQFTGLRDRAGVEIYEGDVVRMFDHPPSDDAWDLLVEWENGKFILTGMADLGEYFGDLSDWFDCEWRVLVIGNRYENPELMEAPHV